jgi:hypothetical protein
MKSIVLLAALALVGCVHSRPDPPAHAADIHAAAAIRDARGYTHVARTGAAFFCLMPVVSDEAEAISVASLLAGEAP